MATVAVEGNIRSPRLPGGDLVSALLNRPLMALADRGSASGMIGERWGDLSAKASEGLIEKQFPLAASDAPIFTLERVVRVDNNPRLVNLAAKSNLQSPDFIFVGTADNAPALIGVDAKFSIETARSRQVSIEVIDGLLQFAEDKGFLAELDGDKPTVFPGLFLAPDYPMTDLMLAGKMGIRRSTVNPGEVLKVNVTGEKFFGEFGCAKVMWALARVDGLIVDPCESLMAGLYYFRIGRGCVACWKEETLPALSTKPDVEPDMPAVGSSIEARAAGQSAMGLLRQWDREVDEIRKQRQAVENAAGLPVITRELREWIDAEAKSAGAVAPSVNQVRKRLGAWHHAAMVEALGPITLPLQSARRQLQQVSDASFARKPLMQEKASEIIQELLQIEPQAVAEA